LNLVDIEAGNGSLYQSSKNCELASSNLTVKYIIYPNFKIGTGRIETWDLDLMYLGKRILVLTGMNLVILKPTYLLRFLRRLNPLVSFTTILLAGYLSH
jgi:hypothetical protein